jgi:c-di-GMP-binding flagellar brake protein YcgR
MERRGMLTRYLDRRRYIRVPAHGPARWRSGAHTGHCELLDISAGGVGLRMSARKATSLGPLITVEVELAPGEKWYVAKNARVVRHAPADDGLCVVGIEFASPPAADRPLAASGAHAHR